MNCPLDELGDHIIGVMVVTKNILPTQQHLDRCFLAVAFDDPQSFPGVLVEETQGAVKSRAAPGF